MKTNCGTLAYTAPEVLARSSERSYTSQCDLWSLGVVVYILLSNRMPFAAGSDAEMQEKILRAEYNMEPEIWGKFSDAASNFVESLLQIDPSARPTAEGALSHPWLAAQRGCSTSSVRVDTAVLEALKEHAQAPKFQRCCRSLLAWMVPNDDHAKVGDIFKKIDSDNDGKIGPSDLEKVMADDYQMSESEVRQIFGALDSNCQKEIRYSDFLAAMLYHEYALHEDVLRAAFNKLRGADSGEIGAEELRHYLGDSFENEAVETLICEADSNNDGFVSYDDFETCVRGRSPLATPRSGLTPSFGNLTGLSPLMRQSMRGGIPLTPSNQATPSSRSMSRKRLVDMPLLEIDETFHMSSPDLTPKTPTLLESISLSQRDFAKLRRKPGSQSLPSAEVGHRQNKGCCIMM